MNNKMVEELFGSILNGEVFEDRIDDTAMREASGELEDATRLALILAEKQTDIKTLLMESGKLLRETFGDGGLAMFVNRLGGWAKLAENFADGGMSYICYLIGDLQNETGAHYFQLGFEIAKQLLTGTSSVDLSVKGAQG